MTLKGQSFPVRLLMQLVKLSAENLLPESCGDSIKTMKAFGMHLNLSSSKDLLAVTGSRQERVEPYITMILRSREIAFCMLNLIITTLQMPLCQMQIINGLHSGAIRTLPVFL